MLAGGGRIGLPSRGVYDRGGRRSDCEQAGVRVARSHELYADRQPFRPLDAGNCQTRRVQHRPHGVEHAVTRGVQPFRRLAGRRWRQHDIEPREHGVERLAAVSGEIVGFSIAHQTSRSIFALFVLPSYENRGLGRRLLDAASAWLWDNGADIVWLTTAPDTRAARFYERDGWICSGVEANDELRFERRRPTSCPPSARDLLRRWRAAQIPRNVSPAPASESRAQRR